MPRNKAGTRKVKIKLLVRQVAESKGFTRTKLSRLADIQYATVNNLFNNPDAEVSLLVLHKVARALKCEVSELYTVENDEE